MQIGDSAARYSHADWAREQQAEPACHAAVFYVVLVRPPYLPVEFCRVLLGTSTRSNRSFRSLMTQAGYTPPTTASSCSSVNRLCNPGLTRSTRWDARRVCRTMSLFAFTYYILLLMRPWVRLAIRQIPATSAPRAQCNCSDVFTGGLVSCTRWWLRYYLKFRARKTSRLTVSWPIISMTLPEGPDNAVSVGPLQVAPQGIPYIPLFTDRFSGRADMFVVTAAEFTSEGTANILIN